MLQPLLDPKILELALPEIALQICNIRESLKSLVFDDRHKLYTSGGIPIAHTYGSSAFIRVADTDKLSGAQIDDLIYILVYLFVRNKTSTVRVDTPRVLNEAEFHGPPLGGLA
jgi:hypothetical protein